MAESPNSTLPLEASFLVLVLLRINQIRACGAGILMNTDSLSNPSVNHRLKKELHNHWLKYYAVYYVHYYKLYA